MNRGDSTVAVTHYPQPVLRGRPGLGVASREVLVPVADPGPMVLVSATAAERPLIAGFDCGDFACDDGSVAGDGVGVLPDDVAELAFH